MLSVMPSHLGLVLWEVEW